MAISQIVEITVEYTFGEAGPNPEKPFTLKAEVIASSFIPPEIYLYQRVVKAGCEDTDEFCAVASTADMGTHPAYIPAAGNPFFRNKVVELEFATAQEAQTVKDLLAMDANQLAKDWQVISCLPGNPFSETYLGE